MSYVKQSWRTAVRARAYELTSNLSKKLISWLENLQGTAASDSFPYCRPQYREVDIFWAMIEKCADLDSPSISISILTSTRSAIVT